jgi:hypothetical protein
MKTALVISLHSCVDLITNSSSELFICNTDKSVAVVKKIIAKLAEDHYEKIYLPKLWKDVFREPEVAKYSFELEKFPRYAEWEAMFGNRQDSTWYSDGRQLHDVERTAQHALEDWQRDNPSPPWPSQNASKKEQNIYERQNSTWNDRRDKVAEVLYKEWNDRVLDIYTDLYAWVAKVNRVNLSKLGKLDIHRGRYCHPYFTGMVGDNYNKTNRLRAAKFIDEINDAISWGYTFKKGDIFLHSASDNTINYDLQDDIQKTFSCQRRHLG